MDFISLQPDPLAPISLATPEPRGPIKFDADSTVRSPLADRQRSFAEVLAIADRMPHDESIDEERAAAEQLVATTLVEPILKQLRQSSTAAPPFGPGEGEKKFRDISDAHTAREIVRSERFGLVERLAQDLRERTASLSKSGKEPTA